MTPEQQAAYVNSQVACALIEAQAMTASNALDAAAACVPRYDEQHFKALIDRYGISHNAVLGSFS